MPDTVDTPSLAYDEMNEDYWERIHSLRGITETGRRVGGTEAMRDAGRDYLPQHSDEEDKQWEYRRNRSFLMPAYDDAILKMKQKPFTKPVLLNMDLPEKLAPLTANMDYSGRGLTPQASDVFDAGEDYGFTHLFVDFPTTGGIQTEGQEKMLGIRPSIIHYTPPSIIGWQTRNGAAGQKILSEVRIKYDQIERIGDYEEAVIKYVRVFREADWELWRKGPKDKEFFPFDAGGHTFGAIPLVTIYFKRTGFMTGAPCLQGLAEENVNHWQLFSDYKNCLHFNLSPTVVFEKCGDAEGVDKVAIGSRRGLIVPGDGTAKILETSGSALGAGREELERSEARMRNQAMEPFVQKTGTPTATYSGISESHSKAKIISDVRTLELAYRQAIGYAYRWVGLEMPDDFSVNIFDDFSLAVKSDADLKLFLEMYDRGVIDDETLLEEVRRRGIFDEGTTVEEIMNRVAMQAPKMDHASIGVGEMGVRV